MSQAPRQSDFPIEQEAGNLIRGKELLLSHYGEWPPFTDVEVIRITLERAPTDDAAVCDLRAIFSTFDINRPADDPKRKQAHTEILFGDISSLSIQD